MFNSRLIHMNAIATHPFGCVMFGGCSSFAYFFRVISLPEVHIICANCGTFASKQSAHAICERLSIIHIRFARTEPKKKQLYGFIHIIIFIHPVCRFGATLVDQFVRVCVYMFLITFKNALMVECSICFYSIVCTINILMMPTVSQIYSRTQRPTHLHTCECVCKWGENTGEVCRAIICSPMYISDRMSFE